MIAEILLPVLHVFFLLFFYLRLGTGRLCTKPNVQLYSDKGTPQIRFISRLGSGSYASVYKAKLPAYAQTVALKVTNKLTGVEELVDEICALRKIKDCPNVNQMLGVITDRSNCYLVLEMAAGDLCSLVMALPKVDINVIKAAVFDLANGLKAVHSMNMIHRDIKPANILVSCSGIFKLADFGLSCLGKSTERVSSTEQIGTSGYMAPEVQRSARYYTSADIWSLGRSLVFMVEGCEMFDYVRWDYFEADFKDLVDGKMLAVEPSMRASAEDILKHPFVPPMIEDAVRQSISSHYRIRDDSCSSVKVGENKPVNEVTSRYMDYVLYEQIKDHFPDQ